MPALSANHGRRHAGQMVRQGRQDTVRPGTILAEISKPTNPATMEFEGSTEGVITKIGFAAGTDESSVGTVMPENLGSET